MNTMRIAILLVLGCASRMLAAEPATIPFTLEQVKELGRAKSSFLKVTNQETKALPAIPVANLDHFRESIAPILNKSCLACHGPQKSEGRLRIDKLNADLLTGPDVERWRQVFNVLSNSEMPPDDEPEFKLADAERGQMVDWLSDEMNKASLARRGNKESSSFRRMSKYEYNYALQDLLGLTYTLADSLPPETASKDGFKNSSEMLQMSAMQFEAYREIGLKALQRATVRGERTEAVTYVISMQEVMEKALANDSKAAENKAEKKKNNRNRQHLFNQETDESIHFSDWAPKPSTGTVAGKMPAVSPVVLVLPKSNELKLNLDRFLPDEGIMRVSIRARRTTENANEYASLRLSFSAHTSNNANFSQVISNEDIPITAPANQSQVIHFDIPLSDIQRNPFRKLATTFPRRDEFLSIQNICNANNRDEPLHLLIDYIEISAPFYETWPPKTHTDIFFESKNKNDEQKYGREVLTKFLERAWRRSITAQEVDPFLDLFTQYRAEFTNFEDAMIEVLATALTTPEFLYITQKIPDGESKTSNAISDLELATRLSFFLWSSIPDDELLALARQGKLKDPEVLSAQVQRMLADPRSKRFSQHFVQQWLGLEGLKSVTHVKDSSLLDAMQEEPIAFFTEVLNRNSSVMDFIQSDYIVINERLANHYGIPQVYGPHFRKVPLDSKTNRGGILTSAAMLTMNSDGKDSHPLKRGKWLLERVLDDPPPAPPPNVPEVDLTDPKILQMTLKERIADHRNKPACISCHAKIDPWGIAFENYDAVGAFRSQISNKPVDATSVLFNKQELAGMDGLKRYLLSDRQDQFARAMVHKMTTYALGRPLSFSDRADIDDLTERFRKQGDRLGDLINLIVRSNIFNSK